jgi:hypothetical protein
MANPKISVDVRVEKTIYYHIVSLLPDFVVRNCAKLICWLLDNKILFRIFINEENKDNYTFSQILEHYRTKNTDNE